MSYKIVFSADLHGNCDQYRKLVCFAQKERVNAVVIGGDIAPKHLSWDDYIGGQREFLRDQLPAVLEPLKASGIRVLLMMGNDDCSSNMDVLESNSSWECIHGKRLHLNDGIDVVGYSHVPITPFGIKDWEKHDLTTIPWRKAVAYEMKKRNLKGMKSNGNCWTDFSFSRKARHDSIETDLKQELYTKNAHRTLYVMHSPPVDTSLDCIVNRSHVGSFAIKQFILGAQPHMTLHGHIHETVDVSGKYIEALGSTVCVAAGNDPFADRLAVILFDLEKPQSAERRIL